MTNYTNIPNQLFEDLSDGKLNHKMFCTLVWLHRRADYKSGKVIKVSAARIRAEMWGDEVEGDIPSERTIQECLKRLDRSGYIKNHHVEGRRGSYAITIQNYSAAIKTRDGESKFVTVNSKETVCWRDLPEFGGSGKVDEVCGDQRTEDAATVPGECGDPSAYTSYSSPSPDSSPSPLERSVSESVCAPVRSAVPSILDDWLPEQEENLLAGSSTPELESEHDEDPSLSESTCDAGDSCRSEASLDDSEEHDFLEGSGDATDLCFEWHRVRTQVLGEGGRFPQDWSVGAFDALLQRGHSKNQILSVLAWLPRSNYWRCTGDPKAPGYLDGPEGFACAYETLLKQSKKFREALGKKKGKNLRGKALKESKYVGKDSSTGYANFLLCTDCGEQYRNREAETSAHKAQCKGASVVTS